MKKYTFSKLINTLISFEEELTKILSEKGFEELAQESSKRLKSLKDSSEPIIVEMTLEPIYTVDIIRVLDEVRKLDNEDGIRDLIRDMYREVSKAMEQVSMEFAEILKSFL